jgi:hypothetical protein
VRIIINRYLYTIIYCSICICLCNHTYIIRDTYNIMYKNKGGHYIAVGMVNITQARISFLYIILFYFIISQRGRSSAYGWLRSAMSDYIRTRTPVSCIYYYYICIYYSVHKYKNTYLLYHYSFSHSRER